jgi:tripartite-type tricarboxylate transporter receptor subunit TctC
MASKAPADGYTLLLVNANLAPNLLLQNKLDVGKRLTGVAQIASLPTVLAVNAALPVKSVGELIALAKSSRLAYSTTGLGTTSNLCGEMLKLAAKVNITHVPYKGGSPAMVAIISGEVAMGFASLASAETVPGVVLETWVGMVAPAGVPQSVLRKINAGLLKAVATPATSQRLTDLGYDLAPGTPEQMNERIRSDIATFSRVIREANIRAN